MTASRAFCDRFVPEVPGIGIGTVGSSHFLAKDSVLIARQWIIKAWNFSSLPRVLGVGGRGQESASSGRCCFVICLEKAGPYHQQGNGMTGAQCLHLHWGYRAKASPPLQAYSSHESILQDRRLGHACHNLRASPPRKDPRLAISNCKKCSRRLISHARP